MKIFILSGFVVLATFSSGCASKKPKSRARNYEGNNSPGITMFEEKPGYPLNTR